jgi:hypothetical protein
VTLHCRARRGTGAGARDGAGAETRARAEAAVAALPVLSSRGSPAPAPGQPASPAAAATAARGGGGARRQQATLAAARGRAEWAAPAAVPATVAPHGRGLGLVPRKSRAAGRRGLGTEVGGAGAGLLGRRGHGKRHCEQHRRPPA